MLPFLWPSHACHPHARGHLHRSRGMTSWDVPNVRGWWPDWLQLPRSKTLLGLLPQCRFAESPSAFRCRQCATFSPLDHLERLARRNTHVPWESWRLPIRTGQHLLPDVSSLLSPTRSEQDCQLWPWQTDTQERMRHPWSWLRWCIARFEEELRSRHSWL